MQCWQCLQNWIHRIAEWWEQKAYLSSYFFFETDLQLESSFLATKNTTSYTTGMQPNTET
jgi:hypothetical protein